MLRIRYDSSTHRAELSVGASSQAWEAIRRTVEERGEFVTNTSGISVSLPWWSFLGLRESLVHVLREYGVSIDASAEAKEHLQRAVARAGAYEASKHAPPLDAGDVETRLRDAGFTRTLTSHQRRNVAKLAAFPAGATFSVPGAGKTTEALAYYFLKRLPETRLLVIAPKNAHAAWEEQLSICVPGETEQFVRLRHGAANVRKQLTERPKLMLITYELLPNVQELIAEHLAMFPTFLFLDESHRMKKGHEGQRGRSVLSLSHLPHGKLILSGTPLPNAVSDLVPQFDFLYPEIRASENDVASLFDPVHVRTTKKELGLPEPRRVQVKVQMKPGQRQLYELLRSEEAREFAQLRTQDKLRLRQLGRSVTRLLQLTANPGLLASATDFAHGGLLSQVLSEGDSPKIEYACKRVRQLASQRKKVVVWSQFVQNVELLATRLSDLGAVYIHGGVEAGSELEEDTREAKIKKFHEDEDGTWVLIANPAACSEGISLHTVCHNAIYLDRSYNAAQYLQSEDRIHRLGLPEGAETVVEIIYCPDSVDESVDRRLRVKVDEMKRVLNDPSLWSEPLEIDPEDDSLSDQDVDDFVKHLLGK